MGGESHGDVIVSHNQLGVVVLLVCDPGHGVDEGHGLAIVGEASLPADLFAVARQLPVRQLLQPGTGIALGQWRNTLPDGLAVLLQ